MKILMLLCGLVGHQLASSAGAQEAGLELDMGDGVVELAGGKRQLELELDPAQFKIWAKENPELLTRLEELMAEADPAPKAQQGGSWQNPTERTDAWLLANQDRLQGLGGLTESRSEDDLVRVLQLRRELVRKAAAPAAETAAAVDKRGFGSVLWDGAKSLAWGLISRLTGSSTAK